MEFIIFLLVGLIVLDLAATRWGFDSRDDINRVFGILSYCLSEMGHNK